ELPVAELAAVPRRDQVSDFHGVFTEPARIALGRVGAARRHEQLIVPRAQPSGSVRYLKFIGADGFKASLALEFALADALEGEPLSLEHGAPLRVVAPA